APAILDHDIIEKLHVPELGIYRHVGGVRAVGIGVLLVEEGALRRNALAESAAKATDLPSGPTALLPSTISTSEASHTSRSAACARIASRRLLAAARIAEPPITTERE